MVFPEKYRKDLLGTEVRNIIQETAEGIAEQYAISMEAIGCDKDHIHLLCGSPSDFPIHNHWLCLPSVYANVIEGIALKR